MLFPFLPYSKLSLPSSFVPLNEVQEIGLERPPRHQGGHVETGADQQPVELRDLLLTKLDQNAVALDRGRVVGLSCLEKNQGLFLAIRLHENRRGPFLQQILDASLHAEPP